MPSEKELWWPPFKSSWWAFACDGFADDVRVTLHLIIFHFEERHHLSSYIQRLGFPEVHGILTVSCPESRTFTFYEQSNFSHFFRRSGTSFYFGTWCGDEQIVECDSEDIKFSLSLSPKKSPVPLSLEMGTSLWSAGVFYPRFSVAGTIQFHDKTKKFIGDGCYEIAKSSTMPRNLASIACDWMYLVFNDSSEIIIWRVGVYLYGGYIDVNGAFIAFKNKSVSWKPLDYWVSQTTLVRYPIRWVLINDRLNISLEIDALFNEQEVNARMLFSGRMWLGVGSVQGTKGGHKIHGTAHIGSIGGENRFFHNMLINIGNLAYLGKA